jgi:Tol biopolymer transport system component
MSANPSRGGPQLIRADLDGNNMCALTQIGEGVSMPDISPDGQTIAFTQYDNLRVIDTLGGPRSTVDERLSLVAPDWSPDGKHLLVVGWMSDDSAGGRLYTLSADKLPAPLSPVRPDEDSSIETAPAWSPDGTQIAFTLKQPLDDIDNVNEDIYIVNADGTNLRQLTDNSAVENDPAWSPDGKQLVFTTYTVETGNSLAIINVDGTGLTRVLESATPLTSPVWTPDYIYFAGLDDATGQSAVHRMKPDGTGREQVTLPIDVSSVDVWMPKQE